LLRGATDARDSYRYQLMLSLFTANTDRQEIYQRILHSGYLDGVIVASTSLADPLIPDLLRD